MKRSEFCEEMNSIYDLHDFCVDHDCSILMDFWDHDEFSDYIDEQLVDFARNDYWRDLMSRLSEYENLVDNYDYVVYDPDECEYVGIDEREFDTYYNMILEWGDDYDAWEPEEEDEEEEEETPPETSHFSVASNDEESEKEDWDDWDFEDPDDCSFDDLCQSGAECVSAVRNRSERENAQIEKDYDALLREYFNL